MSEALIFASTDPQYDGRLFIELQVQAQTWGELVVYKNCFRYSEQFLYTTCSPHVLQKEELLTKIYLYKDCFSNWSNKTHLWLLNSVAFSLKTNMSTYVIFELYIIYTEYAMLMLVGHQRGEGVGGGNHKLKDFRINWGKTFLNQEALNY